MDIRPTGNNPSQSSQVTSGVNTPQLPAKTAAPVELPDAVQQSAAVPNLAQLDDAIKSINKAMQSMSRDVEFSIDDESERVVVKVIDRETSEVLRQIPSEEALAISKALDKLQGLLIKQQA